LQLACTPSGKSISINLPGLETGQYFVVIRDTEGRFLSGKLVIAETGSNY
jgi:hypothetical protein